MYFMKVINFHQYIYKTCPQIFVEKSYFPCKISLSAFPLNLRTFHDAEVFNCKVQQEQDPTGAATDALPTQCEPELFETSSSVLRAPQPAEAPAQSPVTIWPCQCSVIAPSSPVQLHLCADQCFWLSLAPPLNFLYHVALHSVSK